LVVETDSKNVWSAQNSLAEAKIALSAAVMSQKTSVEDAAHSAWHKTVRGETTMGSVSGNVMVQGRSQVDLINASWARIRSTEAEVLRVRAKVAELKKSAEARYAQVQEQEAIVID
jgi:hypothetical protein